MASVYKLLLHVVPCPQVAVLLVKVNTANIMWVSKLLYCCLVTQLLYFWLSRQVVALFPNHCSQILLLLIEFSITIFKFSKSMYLRSRPVRLCTTDCYWTAVSKCCIQFPLKKSDLSSYKCKLLSLWKPLYIVWRVVESVECFCSKSLSLFGVLLAMGHSSYGPFQIFALSLWKHSVLTSLTILEVIAFPCLSMAPSATMIMFNLEPLDRVWGSEHICFTKKHKHVTNRRVCTNWHYILGLVENDLLYADVDKWD